MEMYSRDYLLVYINGRRHTVRGADCWLTLSTFLRTNLGLVGTKIVCSEGDCGSCTVLVGAPAGNEFQYCSIDSCIAFMFQLDGKHVVTVEGLSDPDQLSPVQQSLIDCHGSQCGFCTPGFAMAMTGMLENGPCSTEADWRAGLTGNLCRCTGYIQIFEAGIDTNASELQKLNDRFPPEQMLRDFGSEARSRIRIEAEVFGKPGFLSSPTTVAQAIDFLDRHPTAKVVAGATDIGVQTNKRGTAPNVVLDLNRIAELQYARVTGESDARTLVAGARATWYDLERLCNDELPEFARIISKFGGAQIRHIGTLGGNIINASPIADSLPFLFVMEAELELTSVNSTRTVPITEFYRGYKQLDLRPGELLTRVSVSLPTSKQDLGLYKVSRRRDLDIATFTAAILIELDGDRITEACIALGAVAPTVIRATDTEAFLRGQEFNEATMRSAGDLAVREISPISDVRGAADYRLQLTRNVFLKFYHEQQTSPELVSSHA